MTTCNGFAVSALALVLVACGGGGSSPAPTSGGGGGVAPAPTPAPNPTPTPPPGPTYSTFSELTGEQIFDTTCGTSNGNLAGGGVTRVTTPFSNELELASNRDEPNYTITTLGNLLPAGSVSFDQSDRDLNETAFELYRNTAPEGTVQFLDITIPLIDGQPARYTRFLRTAFRVTPDDNLQARCALGVPTLLTDVPGETIDRSIADFFALTIQNTTIGSVTDTAAFDLDPSIVAFNFNPSTGDITIELTLRGPEILDDGTLTNEITELGTYSATGTFDGGRTNFGGIIANSAGTEVGDFAGWFFGPQGAEIAIAFEIEEGIFNNRFRSRGAFILR